MLRQEEEPVSVARTMSAVRLHEPGGLEALRYEEIETPSVAPGQALVQVHAAAITRDELDWPVDRLPAIPSYEFSGVVHELAPDVVGVSVGEPVFALAGFDHDGAAAEFLTLDAKLLVPKPHSLDHAHSAALPLAALSAWQGLFDHGHLERGQRLLIHGVGGGVGYLAAQLALWRGAHVIGTASTVKMEFVKALGAHEVIDHTETRFEEATSAVDLVFDTVGGELLRRSPKIIRKGGRLVSIAEELPKDPSDESIETVYFVVRPHRDQLTELARLAESDGLKPAIDSVFPLSEAHEAFARSMARGTRGKVVLRVIDE
jgi:NADPH:quinone reductase-like Zn-dependent oxidoreductase